MEEDEQQRKEAGNADRHRNIARACEDKAAEEDGDGKGK